MRENMGLYRGKWKKNGEWVEGHLFAQDDVATILPYPVNIGTGFGGLWWIDDGFDPVDPETVGQFTGMTDMNGMKIFEGDIIEWDENEWGSGFRELVEWNYSLFSMRKNDWKEFCKVIGNIHDNPELLKGPGHV